mmetsp:Transcript_3434/g.7500  ORF Transcript_3434/g.7500 Transcript_3434/m.7500 type:complete len:253 (-) Transcript_3434:511-1269(-)
MPANKRYVYTRYTASMIQQLLDRYLHACPLTTLLLPGQPRCCYCYYQLLPDPWYRQPPTARFQPLQRPCSCSCLCPCTQPGFQVTCKGWPSGWCHFASIRSTIRTQGTCPHSCHLEAQACCSQHSCALNHIIGPCILSSCSSPWPAPTAAHSAAQISAGSRSMPGQRRSSCPPHLPLSCSRAVTTVGSARVLMSPRESSSLFAILRRMRRIILPERVFGRPGAQWMTSGVAMGPMALRTAAISSWRIFSGGG